MLRWAILLPVIIAAIVTGVFLAIIGQLLSETDQLRHSEEVIAAVERIRKLAVHMESGLRGYRLTRDRRFLEPYVRASAALPPLLTTLESLVVDNAGQRKRALLIRRDIDAWNQYASGIIGQTEVDLNRQLIGKARMDQVRLDSDAFLNAERGLLLEHTNRVHRTTFVAVLMTVSIAAIAGAILIFFIRRQLHQVSGEYLAALAAKDRLLATVSHELRTPMTSILGWTTLLRSQDVDAEMSRLALASIEQSARLQSRLVEDLIDVSRAVTGKLRLDLADVDLRQVLHATMEIMKPAAEAKRVVTSFSIPAEDLIVIGDADRLQQILWNLVSNAVRYTPSGGKVDITASRDDDSVVVRVADSGAGIERAFLPHVFEPFAQQDSSTRTQGGLGLGLAIARHLIELHGGEITAASDGAGHGAEFTVRLPLAEASRLSPSSGPRVRAG